MTALAQLAASPPAGWPIDKLALWPFVVDEVTTFRRQWDGPARAAGWDDVSLYGLDRAAPLARLDSMGAAFLVALNGWYVTGVDAGAIAIVSRAGSRLRIYRGLWNILSLVESENSHHRTRSAASAASKRDAHHTMISMTY